MKASHWNLLLCIKFSKINFKIIVKNAQLLKSSGQLENFIQTICCLLISTFEEGGQKESNEMTKFAMIQLSIIIQLQNIFSDDSFKGNNHIVVLFLTMINADVGNLEDHFIKILTKQIEDPKFYLDLFSDGNITSHEGLSKYFLLLMQNINNDPEKYLQIALTMRKENNFTCLLIGYLSKNLHLLETEAEIFEQLLSELARIIIKSNEEDVYFHVVERQLIEGIVGSEYSNSVICFYLLCEFLNSVGSLETAKSYFLLFQELLLDMWNPYCEFSENRQAYVIQILKIIHNSHAVSPFVHPKFKGIFKCRKQTNMDWNHCWTELYNEPTADNYYQLASTLQQSNEIKSSPNLMDLLELAGLCDWKIFPSIVNAVINLITITNDQEQKMVYLLKFNPLQKTEIPLEISHKLLQMLITFMSKSNGYDGLKTYIKKLLNNLLDQDISVRRLYFNSRLGKTPIIKEEETLISNLESLLKDSVTVTLMHVCNKSVSLPQNTFSNQLENLKKLELYSKWLSNQQLSQSEKEAVERIIANLQKACPYPETHSI